jgi:hypothetical protein
VDLVRLILPAVALACFVLTLYRSLAFGRHLEPTLAAQKRAAWGGATARYKQTQAGNRWRLKVRRQPQRRAS